MMLITNHQLDAAHIKALETLLMACKKADGNTIAIYWHLLTKRRALPCNSLYYEQGQLTAFLSLFFFYETACEISLSVSPAFRRQGIAYRLLKEISALLPATIKTLIFSVPQALNENWLLAKGFRYQYSEYQMQRLSYDPIELSNKKLLIRPAEIKDVPALCIIDNACFSSEHPNMAARFYELLNDANYQLFIVEREGNSIGKAHVHWEEKNAHLTDIAILPHCQNQGYGSVLIAHCINYCLAVKHAPITLDVETQNQQALNLYTRLGFIVNNAYDFWTISTEVMANWLR